MSVRHLLLPSVLMLTACASTPRNTTDICGMFEDRRSWYEAAMRSEERWGVPIHISMAFIQQESGFVSRAKPARTRIFGFIPGPRPSDAFGYAQALDSTWEDYKEEAGNLLASRSSFADAVDFVGWYNQNSSHINGIPLNDAYNLYLAYHEGNGGYSRRSYEGKAWLLDTAKRVQANSESYRAQFILCEQAFGRSWFRRAFS